MKEKIVSGTLLTLLLIGMLTLAFNIQLVKTEPTTITVPDDYPTIQEAINAANPVDTIYVRANTYYEHVIVNKTVSLIGENRSTTIIDGNGTGIVVDVKANNTIVSGFTIQNSGSYDPAGGIRLYHCFNSSVSDNNANNNHKAIFLFVCVNCSVYGNTVGDNGVGIRLDRSSSCYIFDNNANSNGHGIFLDGSSNIVLRNNDMIGNSYNFGVQGVFLQEYIHDIDSSNTVDGKPIIYWVNQVDKPVPATAGYVGIVNSTNIVVENMRLTKNVDGVLFAYTTNSSIKQVTTNNDFHGILLDRSHNCFIHDNNVTDNKYGIGLRRSSCCVSRNNVLRNDYGIGLWFSNCSVHDNNINNNSLGFELSRSTGCSVYSNNVINNGFGVEIWHSSNNTIYHNNFINNTEQVISFELYLSTNTWDNGFEGNYWSDYNGTDADQDGIGDTPYAIDDNNQDNYPLMKPWGPRKTVFNVTWNEEIYPVTVVSNSTITDFNFSQPLKQISFNVTGPNGSTGFCNVTIPKVLLRCESPEDWQIKIDDTPITDFIVTENATHTSLYFTYTHTTHLIKITGTKVVGEEEKTLLGRGWGWMRIGHKEYVSGRAELYKIGDEHIELVITYQGEEYSRTWNIIYHREYKYGERYLCYSEEWGFLIVGLHEHRRWQFWYAVGKGVVAFGFLGYGRLRLIPIY